MIGDRSRASRMTASVATNSCHFHLPSERSQPMSASKPAIRMLVARTISSSPTIRTERRRRGSSSASSMSCWTTQLKYDPVTNTESSVYCLRHTASACASFSHTARSTSSTSPRRLSRLNASMPSTCRSHVRWRRTCRVLGRSSGSSGPPEKIRWLYLQAKAGRWPQVLTLPTRRRALLHSLGDQPPEFLGLHCVGLHL